MQIYTGITLNSGFRIGKAKLISPKKHHIQTKTITPDSIKSELSHLEDSISKIELQIKHLLDSVDLADTDKEIIKTHLLILRDPEIHKQVYEKISDNLHSAAYAVQHVFQSIVKQFQAMQNDFFSQRAGDYRDVSHRLLGTLLGDTAEDEHAYGDASHIVLIKEISPSKVISLARSGIKAYCCENGSYNSHSSILSRALGIVALTGINDILDIASESDLLILDGINSRLIVNPDEQTIEQYQEFMARYAAREQGLTELIHEPALTKCGKQINLNVNIELPQEIDLVAGLNCDGIGLFRTEFLYLGRSSLPEEDEQTEIYSKILSRMNPRPVTLRTFDLGGDKLSHLLHTNKEDNPYLGCRGIRFSLSHKDLFRTQIRAMLRASVSGNAKIMFPMIMDTEDFLEAKALTLECLKELQSEGFSIDSSIPLGVMIEVPSAAICSDQLATEADFFSIGTNDLVQYTLAVDRNNDSIARYYIPHHPAVLNLIQLTLHNALKHQIPVSVCGEMASMDEYIPLLIGMGIKDLSVNPNHFQHSKRIIRNCDEALTKLISETEFDHNLVSIEELIFHQLSHYYQST